MRWILLFPWAVSLLAQQAPGEILSRATDRTGLSITLYHGDLAVVRERRSLDLPAGPIRLALMDLSPRIHPKTALFEALPPLHLRLLEQNFEFDLLSPSSLTSGSLGQRVRMREPDGSGGEGLLASLPVPVDIYPPPRSPLEAKLDPMPAVWRAARIYRGRWARIPRVRKDPEVLIATPAGFEPTLPEALAFRSLPGGLRSSPTLLESLEASGPGAGEVQLTYLTGGLSWSVHYTGTFHPSEDRLDLQAMVTLTNESGATFPETRLQLVAGYPNQVPDPDPEPVDPDGVLADSTQVAVAASLAPSFDEERLADYHLFTLDRLTTLAQGQTKQIRLFQVEGIPVHRHHQVNLFSSDLPRDLSPGEARAFVDQFRASEASEWDDMPIQVGLAWTNDEASGLGRPLPEGQLDLVEARADGTLIPLASLPFESLSRGERTTCWSGLARSWVGYRRLADLKVAKRGLEVTWEVDLRHEGPDATPLVLREWMAPGWTLIRADRPSERPASNQLRFTLPPPPSGALRFTYTVGIPWRPRR